MAKLYNMDVKTLKQKIEDLASNDIEWNKLFSEYYGKRNDYNGYDFKSEYGKKIRAVAKCESNDDVLYVLRNGMGRDIYYLVHLTYSAHNADGFPRYEEFADLFAVKEFIERSYIEGYM